MRASLKTTDPRLLRIMAQARENTGQVANPALWLALARKESK